jgi:hypothetical protein
VDSSVQVENEFPWPDAIVALGACQKFLCNSATSRGEMAEHCKKPPDSKMLAPAAVISAPWGLVVTFAVGVQTILAAFKAP